MADNKEQIEAAKVMLGADDKGGVRYEANGEEVKLSFNIVRRFLVRGNAQVTDAEVLMFISLCKANGLNPLTGDCYLIKYSSDTPASMVTSRDAFMRRADSAVGVYQGYQSGVIVRRKDGEIAETEGSFFLRGEEELVGGWAKVYRSDRIHPTYARVGIQEYMGKGNWSSKPGTMIQKVAEAQAFRKAFPTQMSGLYTPDEMPDEQTGTAPAPQQVENAEKPRFIDAPHEEETRDPEAPVFVPDPEPDPLVKAGLLDPEPEELSEKEMELFKA